MKSFVNALSACLLFSQSGFTPYALAEEEFNPDDPVVEQEESTWRRSDAFRDKEDLNIYLNYNVGNLTKMWDESEVLSLLYIFHSDKSVDKDTGQDWTTLDKMFLKVLEELKGGYVNTYAIDCADEHPEVDPAVNLKKVCSNDPW